MTRGGACHWLAKILCDYVQRHINASRNACRGEDIAILHNMGLCIHMHIRKFFLHQAE